MDKDVCIEKICLLPLNVKLEQKSASQLLAESLYYIFSETISIEDIKTHLNNAPHLIDHWLEWSDNKKGSGLLLIISETQNFVRYVSANGELLFEHGFQNKTDACSEYILREIIEILSKGIEHNPQFDLDVIINASVEIGNLMQGALIPESSHMLYYAEGLSQKIINHILTARYLLNGYQLGIENNLFEPKVDFGSIIILTRAALETYLALNYIFIAENNHSLQDFRYLCWDLAGYLERANMPAKVDHHKQLKEDEAKQIELIRNKLLINGIFQSLGPKVQKKALNGEWRLTLGWVDLATRAGINEIYFRNQYKFLCNYAHASRLSVIQIQQNKTFIQQKEMALFTVNTLIVVLAKHMYDYIEIMPALNVLKVKMKQYPIILFWKKIGENLRS
ncbi:MAG: hypothetical protein IPI31_09160 [Bacteroidetes bacterium]|nr:hypothetical protein [Bacteroidota bacterium]